jgi:hypothetical protein
MTWCKFLKVINKILVEEVIPQSNNKLFFISKSILQKQPRQTMPAVYKKAVSGKIN